MALSGFELTMALGLMTPKERIEWETTRDKAEEAFYNTVDRAQSDAADVLSHDTSTIQQKTIQKDQSDVKSAADNYKKALQPPANILARWRKQQEKFKQIHEQFKREYMTSPQYKAQREYAAEWRKKNGIKGDGW